MKNSLRKVGFLKVFFGEDQSNLIPPPATPSFFLIFSLFSHFLNKEPGLYTPSRKPFQKNYRDSNWPSHSVKGVQIRNLFLVRIFPHLDWIQKVTKYLAVFCPNAGNYGPETLDTFHTVPVLSGLRLITLFPDLIFSATFVELIKCTFFFQVLKQESFFSTIFSEQSLCIAPIRYQNVKVRLLLSYNSLYILSIN